MSHIGNEQHIDTGIRPHKSRESDHKQLQGLHVSHNAVIHHDNFLFPLRPISRSQTHPTSTA